MGWWLYLSLKKQVLQINYLMIFIEMFDQRLNSLGAKCTRGTPELRNEKCLNSYLTCDTSIGGEVK